MQQNKVFHFEGTLYHEDGVTLKDVREEWPSNNLAIISAVIWGSDESLNTLKVYIEVNKDGERTEEIIAHLAL